MNVYSGENIFINASEIKIYAEDFEFMNQRALSELTEKYWHNSNQENVLQHINNIYSL